MPEIISTCCGEAAVEESGEWSCSSCDCPCDVEVVTDEDDGEMSLEEALLRDERLRDVHINRLIDRAREDRGGRR